MGVWTKEPSTLQRDQAPDKGQSDGQASAKQCTTDITSHARVLSITNRYV